MHKDTFIDKMSKGAGALAAMMIIPAIIVSAYEVVARYAFNQPTNWVFPVAVALCATSFVMAGPYVLQRNEFIRVTFIYDSFGPRSRRVVDIVSAFLELAWGAVLAVASGMQAYPAIWRFRGGEWRPETLSGAWDAPLPAIMRGVLFLACLLLFLQAAVSLIRLLTTSGPAEMKGDTYVD
jgi:TRAP-type mannitol/chloroaromatic compound transport system permease small subunit